MTEQWQELKETIKELRYSNGNLTQQEVCSFLGVYMETLEKQMQEPTYAKGTIIKSALKYLVKRQIEEGSVGFAVDNDHDHDCCWDDVLAWIEARSCEEDFVKHKKEVLERIAKREREIDKYIKELEALEQQPEPMEKFDDVKTHIQRLAGDYKCWDNRLTWEEALELNRMLEAQPCEDAVNRSELQKTMDSLTVFSFVNNGHEEAEDYYNCESVDMVIRNLPSVTPLNADTREAYIKGYDYGVKDWFKSKTQPCADCISRQAVLNIFDEWFATCNIADKRESPKAKIKALPSVYPERPKGKWIKCKSRFGTEYFKCSECGRKLNWIDSDDNYCNSCGSDNSESTKELYKEKLAEISGGGEDEVGHD